MSEATNYNPEWCAAKYLEQNLYLMHDTQTNEDFLTYDFDNKSTRLQTTPPTRWECSRCGNVYKTMPFLCECHSKQFKAKKLIDADCITYFSENQHFLSGETQKMSSRNLKDEATEILTQVIKKKFYLYTTRHDEKPEIWVYNEGIYVPQGKTYIQEFCRNTLNQQYTPQFTSRVISKIQADTFIEPQEFFDHNYIGLIPVQNGILDLMEKKLLSFSPERIFFTKLPVVYDSTALCPLIDKFFCDVLPSNEDVQTMYELFGYCVWTDAFMEQAFMMLGGGRNGKSKTIDILKNLLGSESTISIPIQDFEKDMYAAAELFGKLANLAGDISDKPIDHSGVFKDITGRGRISGSRKFLTKLSFVSYAKHIFATNKLPKTYDTTDAFWERWVYFRFPFTFLPQEDIEKKKKEEPESEHWKYKLRDPDIVEKLCTPNELSGLLNKAIEGLHRVRESKRFTTSRSAEEVKWFWICESDSFLAFALQHIQQEFDSCVTKEDMRKAYQLFCKVNKVIPESEKSMKRTLLRNFAVLDDDARRTINDEQERVWGGVAFKFEGVVDRDLRGKVSRCDLDKIVNVMSSSSKLCINSSHDSHSFSSHIGKAENSNLDIEAKYGGNPDYQSKEAQINLILPSSGTLTSTNLEILKPKKSDFTLIDGIEDMSERHKPYGICSSCKEAKNIIGYRMTPTKREGICETCYEKLQEDTTEKNVEEGVE